VVLTPSAADPTMDTTVRKWGTEGRTSDGAEDCETPLEEDRWDGRSARIAYHVQEEGQGVHYGGSCSLGVATPLKQSV
jgi:hypothetical protein